MKLIIILIKDNIEMFQGMHFGHETLPMILIDKIDVNNSNDLPSTTAEIQLRQMKELGIEEKFLIESFKLTERDNENYTLQFITPPKPKFVIYNSWTSKRIKGINLNNKKILHRNRKILQN